jgi:hypothetical protein
MLFARRAVRQRSLMVTGGRLILGTFVTIVSVAAIGAGTATPSPGLTLCTGTMTGTIRGNVTVPMGKTCSLQTAVVTGNMRAQAGSSLAVLGDVTVKGNIVGAPSTVQIYSRPPHGPNTITGNVTGGQMICGAVMRGNVTMSRNSILLALGGTESGAACRNLGGGNKITGNVIVSDNAPSFFRVADNQVRGNVIIRGTSGTATKRVLNNSIRGVLVCRDNKQPFVTSGNVATISVGQCAA